MHFALPLREPGSQIRHYRVIRVIGYGGFGAVYEAEVTQRPDVRVALKESFEASSVSIFQSEFEVLRGLRHDHLPRYYEMFTEGENGYLVMELVPGQSLADILIKHDGPLPEAQVLGYAVQICDVLHYLHSQQPPIIHRDVKPANVRLTPDGLVKLVDFGLLKQGSDITGSSRRGFTPDYAPPEQWGVAGEHTGPRSDIYSLGGTLYHLLSGRKPPPVTARLASVEEQLAPPNKYNPRLSAHISDAIMTAMKIQREFRHTDSQAFKLALLGVAKPTIHESVALPANQPGAAHSSRLDMPAAVPVANDSSSNICVLRTLQGHTRWITSVAWSPDGQSVASSSGDNTARIWRLENGERQTLKGHTDKVYQVAWSPDSTLLASAGADHTIRIWRRIDGMQARMLHKHTSEVISLAWSPDGALLASASADATVRLWRVKDGKLLHTLKSHLGRVNAVAWSPDGTLLASASADTAIRLWRVKDGKLLLTLQGHTHDVSALSWSPDGALLASASADTTIRLWNWQDSRVLHTLNGHTHWVSAVAWSPDGRLLASAGVDTTMRLWNVIDKCLLHTVQEHEESVSSVAWSPDSTMLVSGGGDINVRLWRVQLD